MTDEPAETLAGFLREQRRRNRLSMRQLATLAGVSNPYLSQIERGLRRPSADILHRLADALAVAPEALYVLAGMLDEHRGTKPGVIEAIERDTHLTEAHRDALRALYERCRAESAACASDDSTHHLESVADTPPEKGGM